MKLSKEIKVGIIAILAIVIFIWGFNYLKGIDIFNPRRTLYAVYPRVNGLLKANPVFVNGLQIGQVSLIYFEPGYSGDIVVEMTIDSDIPIPVDTRAIIYSSDLMGSKAIDLVLGDTNVFIESGDTLSTEVEASLKEAVNQQIQPLKLKAEELISTIDSAVTVISSIFNKRARDNLASSIEQIRLTFENLTSTTYNLDTLVSSQKDRLAAILLNLELITRNIKDNEYEINNIIDNFSTLSDSLAQAKIPQTFNNINRTVDDLARIADKINSGEGTIGLLVNDDSLYIELKKTASDLNLLLEDIKNNPKKYVRFSLF